MFLLNSRVYIRSGAQTRCDLSYRRLRFAALKGYAKCTINNYESRKISSFSIFYAGALGGAV